MASVATYKEKGSDVNVGAHLLVDVLGGFDAAVVISNDGAIRIVLGVALARKYAGARVIW